MKNTLTSAVEICVLCLLCQRFLKAERIFPKHVIDLFNKRNVDEIPNNTDTLGENECTNILKVTLS